MPTHVYRCTHCGREVLVREAGPLTPSEIARRIEEERRPAASGLPGQPAATFRLRDDIWLSVSAERGEIPREELPERCPACGRGDTLQQRSVLE
jgi:DNA-directed RNA polymerase subunit RPC12/RpoP